MNEISQLATSDATLLQDENIVVFELIPSRRPSKLYKLKTIPLTRGALYFRDKSLFILYFENFELQIAFH